LGYNNEAAELAPDGLRQNVFYTPESAQFYFAAVAYLDAIYDKAEASLTKKRGTALALPRFGRGF
ncbi:MAG TPA: hypothetical protein VGM56_21175, partial [Byssovorax sp.]